MLKMVQVLPQVSRAPMPERIGIDDLLRGYFLSGLPHGFECASLFAGFLSNVYFTSTVGNAPIKAIRL